MSNIVKDDIIFIGDVMKKQYDDWIGPFYGIKPHRSEHDGSFNNIVYTVELGLALQLLNGSKGESVELMLNHVVLTSDINGGYAPKNSHDNLTAKIVGLLSVNDIYRLTNMDRKELSKGKHPRDRILYGFWIGKGLSSIVCSILLPFALLDIVRSILSPGKIRPKWFNSWKDFKIRFGAKLGIYKHIKTVPITGGLAEYYQVGDVEERIIYVQNDGKILSLLRLNTMKSNFLLKPFVRFCKKLYIKKVGKNFQTVLFRNYFSEHDHPVRMAYKELDRLGKTIIDC